MNIEFVDELPPLSGHWDGLHRQEVKRFAEQVRQHPGRWAVYPWTPNEIAGRALASRISRGKISAFADGFQAVSRRGVVYIRYIGKGEND